MVKNYSASYCMFLLFENTICIPNSGIVSEVFANNYFIQITEAGFAEKFKASHRMGPENLSVNSLKRDLSNNATVNPPSLFSLVNKYL